MTWHEMIISWVFVGFETSAFAIQQVAEGRLSLWTYGATIIEARCWNLPFKAFILKDVPLALGSGHKTWLLFLKESIDCILRGKDAFILVCLDLGTSLL